MRTTLQYDVQDCIDVCNSLLRGEISAIETYEEAIVRFASDRNTMLILEKIHGDHTESAQLLRQNVRNMGGSPDNNSGAWGAFANAVQSAADLFGKQSAIAALIEGEEHGRREYAEALENEQVLPQCKGLIRVQLLPRLERHIARLKSLKKA